MKMNYSVSFFWISIVSIMMLPMISCDLKKEISESKEHTGVIELSELMFHNQRYMDKMYFAGINNNWELTRFYHHEMEENMEKIIESKILEDGRNISDLTNQLFMPSLNEMKRAIESNDSAQFLKEYQLLITSCNNCHIASDHAFVKIKLPLAPSMTNQEFKKN